MRAGLLMTVLILTLPVSAQAQISPGELARSHRALEGAGQCLKCHSVSRRESMDRSCLACHRDISWLRTERRGLHAREATGRCSACHPDHAGVEFALVAWSRDSLSRFDHRRAGWILDGAHAQLECNDCHTAKYRRGQAATLAPDPRSQTWTGLDPTCLTCHQDVHRGSVPSSCNTCHETGAWSPAGRFDHDSTRYPLTGRHGKVECTGCHPAAAAPARGIDPAFPPVRFAQCSTCHRDPHQGRLGAQCADCHVTTGFGERGPRAFDHSRTPYPLRGAHSAVECGLCHGERHERPRPAATTCGACHADAHSGTATFAGRVVDCAACHDERGFRSANFGVEQHRITRYPLEGRHQAVTCGKCHRRERTPSNGPAGVLLRPRFAACRDCHTDPHRGESGRMSGGECASCHTVNGWNESVLEPAQHAALGFPLVDRHAQASCGACHPVRNGQPVFRLGRRECIACHLDPHQQRYTECSTCHTARAFRPSTVDSSAHSTWRLPLQGAHRAVPCAGCHTQLARAAGGAALAGHGPPPKPLSLELPGSGCVACHADPHGGQFSATAPRACQDCHGVEAFQPADRFDHARDAAFGLAQGHERVACVACHPQGRYRGTPTRCEVCHQ